MCRLARYPSYPGSNTTIERTTMTLKLSSLDDMDPKSRMKGSRSRQRTFCRGRGLRNFALKTLKYRTETLRSRRKSAGVGMREWITIPASINLSRHTWANVFFGGCTQVTAIRCLDLCKNGATGRQFKIPLSMEQDPSIDNKLRRT